MDDNPVIFQSFEWNIKNDQKHYRRLFRVLPALHSIGITALWLPPACKAGNSTGNGYDIYDLYDLGEFEQRGSRSTKWGPKEDLMALSSKAKELHVGLYFDAVLNHRCGGDAKEVITVVEVDPQNRNRNLTRPKEIEAWLRFDFPGRRGKYSPMRYTSAQYNASDWDDRAQKNAIYKIVQGGKDWAKDVSDEWGNGDYLMFNNLDYTNKALRDDVNYWGVWVTQQLGLSGFRLDAMQHFSQTFSSHWMKNIQRNAGRDIFFVGEYWNGDVAILESYLKNSPPDLYLYDAPLLYNFGRMSHSKNPDLRTVFERSLVSSRPRNAVTLVMNHDTQKGQVMDTPISAAFTSLAYALTLLRRDGYPCVFYGDVYGTSAPHVSHPTCGGKLPDLVLARKLYAYGEQVDYFSSPGCIGWVRKGITLGRGHKASGMAVVMSWVGEARVSQHPPPHHGFSFVGPVWARKLLRRASSHEVPVHQFHQRMNVGVQHAGQVWTDLLKGSRDRVTIGRDGFGVFSCQKNTVAIYVSERGEGRENFPVNFETNIYG
ncbi:glucan 1,4-alpha-maltohexaosidase precursor [Clohesyomyces aquaticus]|uniref:Glucan 1,4-alpha-maltohexaosidase n=1 Tax=Clohesyomyces aquaticus TaxID=1231657 RepID=A0A1Y1ZWB9_9PLEO|nr:glucan 1,4-alpha-maltohexaosidase precursor [Clohesyomyces aquaticus]